MSPERAFPNAPDGVRDARAFVADALRDTDSNALDAAVLMVSELATNAVVHTTSAFTIGIDRVMLASARATRADDARLAQLDA